MITVVMLAATNVYESNVSRFQFRPERRIHKHECVEAGTGTGVCAGDHQVERAASHGH
jgi:hypothetical protein